MNVLLDALEGCGVLALALVCAKGRGQAECARTLCRLLKRRQELGLPPRRNAGVANQPAALLLVVADQAPVV